MRLNVNWEESLKKKRELSSAYTLIEIIIVISLIAFAYTIALPNLGVQKESQIANKLGQLNSDIRSAYDLAVLNHKTYRMVFHLMSGDYWLEVSNQKKIYMSNTKIEREEPRDPEEQKEIEEVFLNEFSKYEDIAGEGFKDSEDKDIPAVTPVIKAKEALRPPQWFPVKSSEWGKRSLGEELIIKTMQAEHHIAPISIDDLGNDAYAYIYFFPSGYVEKAFMHIFYRANEYEIDQDQEPYTFRTKSYQGEATTVTGLEEVNLNEEI